MAEEPATSERGVHLVGGRVSEDALRAHRCEDRTAQGPTQTAGVLLARPVVEQVDAKRRPRVIAELDNLPHHATDGVRGDGEADAEADAVAVTDAVPDIDDVAESDDVPDRDAVADLDPVADGDDDPLTIVMANTRPIDYGDGANYRGDSLSPVSTAALTKERSRHHLAKRARSRSRSATPTRRESRGDFEDKLRRARAQDEEQRNNDPRAALISKYLAKRADGQTDAAARGDLSAETGLGRREHLAELMEAADAMHEGVVSEVGPSLLQDV